MVLPECCSQVRGHRRLARWGPGAWPSTRVMDIGMSHINTRQRSIEGFEYSVQGRDMAGEHKGFLGGCICMGRPPSGEQEAWRGVGLHGVGTVSPPCVDPS